jgi:3-hydroxyisobutyrate dehydrogenase-like beta-hydroxyacid dehydrogenase
MAEMIGFIGTGNMGEPIAENLRRAGYGVRVYNRTRSKLAHLVEKGAVPAMSPADVAQSGGIVFTMLADDHAVEEICFGEPSFVEALGKGGIHVSSSTISPATARRLAEHHDKYGVAYVAAPVFGRPDAAAAAKLVVCTSGPAEAKKRIEPMLAAIGQKTYDFGAQVGAANVVKLCGNFMIASALESLAEALTLAEKNGIDKRKLAEIFGQTLFACPVYRDYGKQIAEEKFQPAGFRLALGLKDIDLAWQVATASDVPMPIVSVLHDRWLASVAKGRESFDWSAIALDVTEEAGIKAKAAP